MKQLQKKYKEVLHRLSNFRLLSKCRNMDTPNNLHYVYAINLSNFLVYFNDNIAQNANYNLKFDYTLITLVYNYVASVKSYLNRKSRSLYQNVPKDYKQGLVQVLEKYWKAGRDETSIDKIIKIRNKLEHENLTAGISLKSYYSDTIKRTLLIDNIDIIMLFNAVYDLLDKLNTEIEEYINTELNKIGLRDCILFMNAFYKRFKHKEYSKLYPNPSETELDLYDKLIDNLLLKNNNS